MGAKTGDPSEAIRLRASRYPGVDEGTSCTQSSFKCGKSAFLFIGMQGGRWKAMFKLKKSRAEAERLAAAEPDRFQVGSAAWVTARFTAEEPLPRALWERWLDESHAFCLGDGGKKTRRPAAGKRRGTSKGGGRK